MDKTQVRQLLMLVIGKKLKPPVEQVPLAEIARDARISEDSAHDHLIQLHAAGCVKFTGSVVYDFDPQRPLPTAEVDVTFIRPAVGRTRTPRSKSTSTRDPVAADDLGRKICVFTRTDGRFDLAKAIALAQVNGFDVPKHLDNGRKAMYVSNQLRTRAKRGVEIVWPV